MHESPALDETLEDKPPRAMRRLLMQFWFWCKRIALTLIGIVLLYFGIVLLGLIPVNGDFVEAENGIEIFVFSGEFHSDIILPINNEVCDWRTMFPKGDFSSEPNWATHIAFGWGDREFYINTPSWKDLKISTALNALLLPSETVVHVDHSNKPLIGPQVRSVTISPQQYGKLVEHVKQSLALDEEGNVVHIPNVSYGYYDAFYVGSGSYHAFRTCNCWVGSALRETGVKTGWFTPLPKTVFLYFP